MKKYALLFSCALTFGLFLSVMSQAFAATGPLGTLSGHVDGKILVPADQVADYQQAKGTEAPTSLPTDGDKGTVESTLVAGEITNADGSITVYRGLPSVTVKVGNYTTTTDNNGNYYLTLPYGVYQYQIINVDGTIIKSGEAYVPAPQLSDGSRETYNGDTSSTFAEVQASMGFSEPDEVTAQTHTHGGAPHCNKAGTPGRWAFPYNSSDCGWALFKAWIGVCWKEAMNHDYDSSHYNAYCNGYPGVYKYYAPCGYTGGHGISCSYFRYHKENYHYN